MKKIALLTLIFSTIAQGSSFTFKELILNKNIGSAEGINFTGYLSVERWCKKRGTAYEISSFQAAIEMEKLENGLYLCKGQFMRLPFEKIKTFQIEDCLEMNKEELSTNCKD